MSRGAEKSSASEPADADGRLYQGPVVDAHHHLWNISMGRHLWLRPEGGEVTALGDLEPIRRDYLVEDYLRDAANQRVVATVHIEAQWDRSRDPVDETRWLETLDKSKGVASRYVVFASLADPDVGRILETHAAFPRVVGVRETLSWHPEPVKRFAKRPDVASDPAWRRGLGLLGRHEFSLDVMLYPYQAADLFSVAKDFPEQQIILNHCGSPIDRDAEGMERWRSGLRLLAQAPNVAIKISAIAAYDPSPTFASEREVAMHCIECFGVSRTMFGSDYPVGRLSADFDDMFDKFKRIAREFSPHEQAALFHDNARSFYRIAKED